MADFQSSKTAQEIEEVFTGAVLFNTSSNLSEAQKAQARANIGATSYGEGIKIVSHFDTLDELKSMIAEPKPGDAYSVGLTLPYNLYLYDGLLSEWKDYGAIRSTDIKARFAQNKVVAVADWEEDTNVFVDYSYKAKIPIGEVTGDDFPIVAFSPFDATCGNFCPIAYCFDGYVEIWAKELPTEAISVPAITFIVQEDGGTGNSTKGITNACGGTPTGGVDTNQLANGAVTAKKLSTDAVTRMFAATIGVEWTGDIAPYAQTVAVDGLPNSDRIFAMLDGSDDWETSLTEEEEFNKVAKIIAAENKLIVYADDTTTVPLNIKIMVFHGSGVGGDGDMGGSENGGGGGAGAFVFEVSGDAESGYTSTASYDEILAAYNSGQIVNCKANVYGDDVICQLFLADDEGLMFSAVCGNLCVIVEVKQSEVTLELAQVANASYGHPTPQDYGAKGDGSTDDTTAFRDALAANRVVFVPGGTYKLSGELTIGNNCCMELSQDTVLEFTQTSGNCISLKMLSWIKGNHASVKVPYGFTGNVIYSSTSMLTSVTDIPAFKHWDPQWKPGRYITDLNILKPDTNGLHYARVDGKCNGTGIYLHANGNDDPSRFMMGIDFSGLRIAGAFTYGIRSVVENAVGDSGFNFDMRLDGFIEACETGVLLDGNINPVMSMVVQPQKTQEDSNKKRYPYAKVGIKLVNTINANLIGSSVWDWDSDKTLQAEGNENQHLVMKGDCRGAILNERYYWSNPNYDIRSLIYTDTPSNLEKLVIINEPFTRWFKPVDLEPYFDNGESVRRLALHEELDEIASVEKIPNFTDVLPTAIDKSGAIFEGTGFARYGMRWNSSNGALITNEPYYGCTGLIPVKSGDRIYVDGIKLIYSSTDTTPNVVLFKSDFSHAHHATAGNIKTATWFFGYEETEEGFIVDLKAPCFTEKSAAYVAFSFSRTAIGQKPRISINNPISYTVSGVLAEGIKVKAENIVGLADMIAAALKGNT